MMNRAIKTLTFFNPKELTHRYAADTLPAGWYWFSIAGVEHIGRYQARTEQTEPVFYSATNCFIGTLKTISVLAEIPSVYDLTNYFKEK